MKNILPVVLLLSVLFASCQANGDKPTDGASAKKEIDVVLCEFSSTDSATAMSRLQGKWELRGIKTNYMGAQEDEFLTGDKIGEAKSLTFFENGEYEEHVNGRLQGERQSFKIVGQSLPPVGYQFWFCDENTLVINNVIADGATEVFIRQ
ncbi:hypothetical protein [Rufibacter tibetensis]|uniref:Lipocalin-like domain-containing protein n=1 Tax=Rufibacter tibetensis TaxID=512763 RepID=A0A0P0CVU7_9BACT|nr:hypothetical protein [Rufibacter tibetensis]ALI99469.1 hypothetical protein DC20_11450 [Rufibacter tibetensis]